MNRPAELRRNLLYVVIAEATNMGLAAMAESAGVPYDVLAWTAEWYFRPETLEANAAIVNYHHRLPMAQAFGTGTVSSSDGQRFPVKGKSITARHLSRYFARGQGISTYTHVSDQHATFDTRVIVATAPESHYVLDALLGNQTDLPLAEHATDTAGATLANFALFDLVGRQLSPRVRDLGKITLYRTGPRQEFASRYPRCGPRLTRRLNAQLISDMWDDLLRVAASVKGATPPPPPRWSSGGCARRKGSRTRSPAGQGREPPRSTAGAGLRGRGCAAAPSPRAAERTDVVPHVATNAIVTWTTEYHGLAVAQLRQSGRHIDDALLAHIWPTHHENVHFYGSHAVDIDSELAKLDTDGYRPLRPADTAS